MDLVFKAVGLNISSCFTARKCAQIRLNRHNTGRCSITVRNIIEYFIYPTDAQIDCSKNVKIYIKFYMRGATTCFGFSQLSSRSYYMCFAKVISINNQLKYFSKAHIVAP